RETAPPWLRLTPFLRHWYVNVGCPVAVTENDAESPEQIVRFDGAVTVIGMRSYAPMSTIPGGTLPKPVSGMSGSSKNRGSPRTSSVVPPGTSVLLPASTTGEDGPGRRSPGGARKRGSASMLPDPAAPPATALELIVAVEPP